MLIGSWYTIKVILVIRLCKNDIYESQINTLTSYKLLTYFSILLVIKLCKNGIYESQLDTLISYELLTYILLYFISNKIM